MPEINAKAKHGWSYRPRPHRLEAVRWTGWIAGLEGGCPEWLWKALDKTPDKVGGAMRVGDTVHVGTPRGILIAEPGDWIVRGPCGALAVIPAGTFREIYERAPEVP